MAESRAPRVLLSIVLTTFMFHIVLAEVGAPSRLVTRERLTGALNAAAPAPARERRAGSGGVCRLPEPTALFALWDASGHTSYGTGNYDACAAGGFDYCLLQLGGEGGVPVGLCLPTECAAELLTCGTPAACANTTAWQYAVESAPVIAVAVALAAPVYITCGDNARADWSPGAVATVAMLSALAAAVAAATLYAAAPPPSGPAPEAGWLARLASRASLTATLPPLLGAQPRRRRPGAVDLGALDGVRVVSLSTVILFHTLVFATPVPGFVNPSDAAQRSLLSPAAQVFSSAWLAVDSFFVLSGALGAYLLAREVAKALPHWAAAAARDAALGDAAQLLDWARAAATAVQLCRAPSPASATHVRLLDTVSDDANKDAIGSAPPPEGPTYLHMAQTLAEAYASLFVHRFLRLFPSLLATVSALYYVMPLTSSGPYWFKFHEMVEPCSTHRFWYAAFMLLNVDADSFCGIWLWSVAVDFQLYATVLPLLAFVYSWRPAAGWLALAASTAISLGVSGWAVADAQVSALFDVNGSNAAAGLSGNYWKYFYTRPWSRAPAFLIGVALGFALTSYERMALRLRSKHDTTDPAPALPPQPAARAATADAAPERTVVRIARLVLPSAAAAPPPAHGGAGASTEGRRRVDGPATAALALALLVLGLAWYAPALHYAAAQRTPPGGWSREGMEAFTVASRPLWSAALAVVLYLCATGRGGALHAVLSHPLWAPYARVSYCAYLLHPIVICTIAYSATSPARFTAFNFAVSYTATLVLVAAAAAVLHLVVEAPCAAAEQALVGEAVAVMWRGARRDRRVDDSAGGAHAGGDTRPSLQAGRRMPPSMHTIR